MGLWARLWAAGYEFMGTRIQKIEVEHRRRLVGDLSGEVLEVGAGTGFNFPHYRGASRVVAVEPEEAAVRPEGRAVDRAAARDRERDARRGLGQPCGTGDWLCSFTEDVAENPRRAYVYGLVSSKRADSVTSTGSI